MRVVHHSGGESRVLARRGERLGGVLEQTVGLIGRTTMSPDDAVVFEFGAQRSRAVHSLGLPFGIDAVFLADSRVVDVATLRPWCDIARARADRIVELAAGGAASVDEGDRVEVQPQ